MYEGTCHCGAVHWTHSGEPDSATTCNCKICRRYGVMWIYGYDGDDIHVTGPVTGYIRQDLPDDEEPGITFDFCPTCGCVVSWRGLAPGKTGRTRTAVNIRLSEPETVAHLPIRHFDGLGTFDDLPDDGRRVHDMWF